MSGSSRPRAVEMTADLVSAPGGALAPPEVPRRPLLGPRASAELPEVVEETPRKTVSVKLSPETIDRLREYTHRTRHQKQDVVEVALVRFLDAEGY
jgi:hypothetical protein